MENAQIAEKALELIDQEQAKCNAIRTEAHRSLSKPES